MATKRGKAKKKNPCWKGYTAMGSDGKIVMKKEGNKMVPACRPIKSKDGASIKDPDIKAAKKEIRKGANVLGGGNAIDDFGHKHGYHSDKTKELDNSRLVQRKKRKYVKEANKSRIKDLKSKESKKEWNDPEAIASGLSLIHI